MRFCLEEAVIDSSLQLVSVESSTLVVDWSSINVTAVIHAESCIGHSLCYELDFLLLPRSKESNDMIQDVPIPHLKDRREQQLVFLLLSSVYGTLTRLCRCKGDVLIGESSLRCRPPDGFMLIVSAVTRQQ